jgi:hypothetical protein
MNGLPDSCTCKDDYYWYNCDEQGFYRYGCFYRLKDAIFDLQEVMAWVAIGVASFEVFDTLKKLGRIFHCHFFAVGHWSDDSDLR